MQTKLTALCASLLMAALALPAYAESAPVNDGAELLLVARVPTCPERARGEPHPEGCVDRCPKGLVDYGQGCKCPTGTVAAERPRSPDEKCVKAKPIIVKKPSDAIILDRVTKCPEGHLGTPPNCYCPTGLTGPKCDQVLVR